LPENAIIQISLGNAELSKQELRWAYRQVTTSPGQTLLVTLGSNGAVWANDRDTEAIAVDPVANPFTLGAGAVLASSLVTALADSESPTIGAVIAEAVAQATRYVQDASAGGEMLGLRLW
jgi:fructose-1-phosphate kinase PfkB-like protein